MTYRYISNFARTKGAKDKQERKRRNVGGYTAGAYGAGGAGLAGAGYLGYRGLNASKAAQEGERTIKRAALAGKKAFSPYGKGALAAGLLGGGIAAGLGAKAYMNRKNNQVMDRNQAKYEGSLAGRSKAAVGALKQKASDIRSGAASKYQSAKQSAKDKYNRAFPKYE